VGLGWETGIPHFYQHVAQAQKNRKRRPGTVWTADGDGLGGSG
jgi:hypothetical protein